MVHGDIADADILDVGATATHGFDADAPIRAIENAVGNADIAHATGHFAADDHAAVAARRRAVHDGVILRWTANPPSVRVPARLDGDAIIARIDVAIGNMNIAAGISVDAVRVGAVVGIIDDDAMHGDAFAI